MASEFDILHFHIDQFHFPIFHEYGADGPSLPCTAARIFPDLHTSLSTAFPTCRWSRSRTRNAQPIPDANFVGTDLSRPAAQTYAPYARAAGRLPARFSVVYSPEKRVDRAIAHRACRGLAAEDCRQGRSRG